MTEDRPPASPRRGGGVTFAVLGILLAVMAVGVSMLQRVSRQRYRDAHRFTHGEVAMNLAHSGLNFAWERLRAASISPDDPLYPQLISAAAADFAGRRFPVASPPLDDLTALYDGDAAARVELEVATSQPLYPASATGGLGVDPREKTGRVSLRATGTYRGVTRRLVATRRFTVVDLRVPVLSKFTLFVRDRAGRDPNSIRYDRLDPAAGLSRDGEPARPLVLYHRAELFPAVIDREFAPLREVLSETEPDAGGLVYLGGEPWRLNLVHGAGAGPFEELHLVRRLRYRGPAAVTGARRRDTLTFGMYAGVFESPRFGALRAPGGFRAAPGEPVVPDRVADLHLSGDIRAVSPTVVLGPVTRRYVRLDLIDGFAWPGRSPGAAPAPGFPGTPAEYAGVMPRVVEEAYNRTWDFLSTNAETLSADGVAAVRGTPITPPPSLVPGALRRVRAPAPDAAGYLYPAPDAAGGGACRIVRDDPGETELFRGDLGDLGPAVLAGLLARKVTRRVRDEAALRAACFRGPDLDPGGVVALESGDLTLGATNVRAAGIILVPGDVTLTGRVVRAAAGGPLTLVSLDGDIRVQTGEKIDAHLVSLRGRFTSRGRLRVVGGVAAERLDLAAITRGAEPKTIRYDEALDPTDPATDAGLVRLYLSDEVVTTLE